MKRNLVGLVVVLAACSGFAWLARPHPEVAPGNLTLVSVPGSRSVVLPDRGPKAFYCHLEPGEFVTFRASRGKVNALESVTLGYPPWKLIVCQREGANWWLKGRSSLPSRGERSDE